MELWHGSNHIIEHPQHGVGNPRNDYGLGFYCTQSRELACEWACAAKDSNGVANSYILHEEGLSVLDFSDFSVLHWMATLIDNRTFRISSPIAKEGAAFLHENYLIDLSPYDIVRGYRADDSYFSYAQAFLNNTLSVGQLSRALKLGNLGEQIVLKSKRAFDRLEFSQAISALAHTYYPMRLDREIRAKEEYRASSRGYDRGGAYLADLLRNEGGAYE